jgi:hypothetical protein
MRSQLSRHRFRPLGGVLATLAVAVCVGPGTARAGCAHYVTVGQSHDHAPFGLELLTRDSAGTASLAAAVPSRPRPCTGALCSGKPAVPLPSPVSALVGHPQAEEWVGLSPAPVVASAAGGARLTDDVRVRPIHEGASIDRPPRG